MPQFGEVFREIRVILSKPAEIGRVGANLTYIPLLVAKSQSGGRHNSTGVSEDVPQQYKEQYQHRTTHAGPLNSRSTCVQFRKHAAGTA